MKKLLIIMMMLVFSSIAFVGCTSDKSAENVGQGSTEETMVVDKDKKEIIMEAEVNGKYFTTPTRHGVVFKDGSNGEKAVLRGLADEKEFHQALLDIGTKPGNNLTLKDTPPGTKIEGDKLDVFVTWDGLDKEIPFNDIIKSDDPRPMDIRFGGNIDRAKDKNTGCVLCLDSCPVGITSNHNYGTGESEKIKFYGKEDVLPKDGTKVSVIFRQAE